MSVGLVSAAPIWGDDRSMSFNTAVQVLPAPGPVVIDGRDNDWDLSAGVWSYNDPTLVERYSVWTHLMWDSKGVYFLGRYHDSTPMQNAAAGKDFQMSWRADCFQARVIFDDRTDAEHQMHINMYYSSPDQRPYMIIHHGGFRDKPPYDATGPMRKDQMEKYSPTMEKHGGEIVVRPWDSGKGYNMEAFWPWSYCRTSGQSLKPGEEFTFGIEAMWGNADGTLLSHRLADGIKDDTVNRIFMFRARNGWGAAVIRDRGGLDIAKQQIALHKARLRNFVDYDTHGSVPIAYSLPEKRDVTIAIDDANGQRVRNLFGQYPRDAGEIVDKWDCLDDDGAPVAPGAYTATVVHHRPIELTLVNSCYSSATPPWVTEAGSKLWGSNHGHPTGVATRGEVTILTFTGTEGGSGIQRIDDSGKIVWTDANEFLDAAVDEEFVYGLSRSSWQKKTLLFRFRLRDGHLTPFDDEKRTPSPALLDHAEIPNTASLALAGDELRALIPGIGMLRIDPKTGAVKEQLPCGTTLAVTDREGQFYTIENDGRVLSHAKDGDKLLFQAKDLRDPVRLSVSQDGTRIAISDQGTNQVHVFDRSGRRLHTIGTSYEEKQRPAGRFVLDDLIQPLGTGFDHTGRLWISEAVGSCKRVTCWSPSCALLDQFWGQADYGAMSGFPLTFDSGRFVAHGIEFKLDPSPDPWRRKTNEHPLTFQPELAHERGFIVQYGGHEYALAVPGYNKMDHLSIFKRDDGGVFRQVVRLELAGRRLVDDKWVEVPGRGWIDRNENGKEDDGEVTENVDISGVYWANGWVRPDLTILTATGNLFRPSGVTASGVPLYDFSAPEKAPNWIGFADRQGSCGTPLIDAAGNISNGITYHTVDGKRGSYPNPYGRHDAPAAQRGLLIAPFRTNGVVEDVPGVGSVLALGGDRGEWFLLSMDGLYISNLCQDSKGNVALDETFIGQESFGGFFWRDTRTGKVYVQLGGASYRIMEVLGLDTTVKETRTLTIAAADLAASAKIVAERQQETVREPERLRIARVRALPDAPAPVMQPSSRPLIPGGVDVRVAERGNPQRWWRASLAHDGRALAIMFQVADPSPWKNGQGSYTHAFIGGDCVDLHLDVPDRGPIRLLAAPISGKPTAVYWQAASEEARNAITYMVENNPNNATRFDVVKRLTEADVKVATGFNSYTVLIRVALAALGLDGKGDTILDGQLGVIYSDPSGTNRAVRLYWHNKQTGLVSDVPSEARLTPKLWGEIVLDR